MRGGRALKTSILAILENERYLPHYGGRPHVCSSLDFIKIKDDYRASTKAKDVSFEDTFPSKHVEDNCSGYLNMPTVSATKAQPRCMPNMRHI
jgi:hypothetical protein